MSKKQLAQLFEEFLRLRYELAALFSASRILRHDDYRLPERLPDMVFGSMADNYTRELIGGVNRFALDIHNADCWTKAAGTSEREQRLVHIYEFAEPLLELSVYRPYSLRNQFIFASTNLLHQSNRLIQKNWRDELPDEWSIDEKVLRKKGTPWKQFPNFLAQLNLLNDNNFKEKTHNYRHLMQHRFRVHFDMGLAGHFRRLKKNGKASYSYSVIPPLEIVKLTDLLYEQHSRAMLLFKAYWELLNELCNRWSEETGPA